MKLSARNQLQGVVCEIHNGITPAVVKIEVRNPAMLTATLTLEALDALGLKVGQQARAVIKASDVIVGVEDWPAPGRSVGSETRAPGLRARHNRDGYGVLTLRYI
jgi:molybdopterin-binding protein